MAFDQRGHGETVTEHDDNLSAEALAAVGSDSPLLDSLPAMHNAQCMPSANMWCIQCCEC